MSVTLYHCKNARSLRPLWTLEELELQYELTSLPFPPRIYQKDFKTINPLGTVPFLIDGNVRMTESVAMCQYLVARYGQTSSLAVDQAEPDYGSYLNWLAYSDATITFPLTLILRYNYLEPEERRQPQVVDDYKAFFFSRLRLLETALSSREYLCGDRFTLADICVGYALHFAGTLGITEIFESPDTERYWQRIIDRPAYQRAIQPLEVAGR